MRWQRVLCWPLLWAATGLAAQEPTFRAEPLEACLQETVERAERFACIGAASDACLSEPANRGGSYVESFCYDRERAYWDDRLNSSYARIMADATADDPALADALRDMQRAWITYRDARCQAVFDAWGDGTGRSPALMACLMQVTAEQTLFLEGRL